MDHYEVLPDTFYKDFEAMCNQFVKNSIKNSIKEEKEHYEATIKSQAKIIQKLKDKINSVVPVFDTIDYLYWLLEESSDIFTNIEKDAGGLGLRFAAGHSYTFHVFYDKRESMYVFVQMASWSDWPVAEGQYDSFEMDPEEDAKNILAEIKRYIKYT